MQGIVELLLGATGEEVDARQLGEGFAQFAHLLGAGQRILRVQPGMAGVDFAQQPGVIGVALEQRDKALAFGIVDRQQVGGAVDRQNVTFDGDHGLAAGRIIRQQVGAIAQHGGTAGLQGAPGPHARGGIGRGQTEDQAEPFFHSWYYIVSSCSYITLDCAAGKAC
ncbi:hypothetical protein D3C84_175830 [compost metagenome]